MSTIKSQVNELWRRGFTTDQIHKETGLTKKQIRSCYSKYGWSANRYPRICVWRPLEQLLIGSILGDGSFTKIEDTNHSNSRLSIAHTENQRELLDWKKWILSKHNLDNKIHKNIVSKDEKRYKKDSYVSFRLRSKTHPIFTYYRNKFYDSNGEKRVYAEYVRKLDKMGLAIWFMDDGNRTDYGYQLNTQSFTNEEIEILINYMNYKWGLKCSIHNEGRIYIWSRSVDKFRKLVSPFMLNCVRYKLETYMGSDKTG